MTTNKDQRLEAAATGDPPPAAVVANDEGDCEGSCYVLGTDQQDAYRKLKQETGYTDEELLDSVEFAAIPGQLLEQTRDPYELVMLASNPGLWGYCYDCSSDFRESPERVALVLGDQSGADLAALRRANYPEGFHVTAHEALRQRRILTPQQALLECPHECVSLRCWSDALKHRARQLGLPLSRWENADGDTLCSYRSLPCYRWDKPGLFGGDYCRAGAGRASADCFDSVWLPRRALETLRRELGLGEHTWPWLPVAQRDLGALYQALREWYLGEADSEESRPAPAGERKCSGGIPAADSTDEVKNDN